MPEFGSSLCADVHRRRRVQASLGSSGVKALRLSKTASKQPLQRPDEPGQPHKPQHAASADCCYCYCLLLRLSTRVQRTLGERTLVYNVILLQQHYYCYLVKLLYNIQALLAHTYFDSKKRFSRPISMPRYNFFFVSNHVKNEMNESIRKLVVWWVQSREEEEETAGSSCQRPATFSLE